MTKYVLTLYYRHKDPSILTFESSKEKSELLAYMDSFFPMTKVTIPIDVNLQFGDYSVYSNGAHSYTLHSLSEWTEEHRMSRI